MIGFDTPEIKFATDAVRGAALLARQIRRETEVTALAKEDSSPVTIADYACQAVVGALLESALPGDALVAEEDSQALASAEESGFLAQVAEFVAREIPEADTQRVRGWIDRGGMHPGGRFWTLDPIDGTKGFLRGDQYAIALALIVDGEVQLGAIGCPNLRDARTPDLNGPGTLAIALRGGGSWITALDSPGTYTQLKVSGRSNPAEARMLRSFESGHTNTGQIGELIETLQVSAEPIPMDSQAKYCVLASGAGDLMIRLLSSRQPDYREKIWDQAAGSIIVEEAGGLVTDLHGARLDFSAGRTLIHNRGVLASNRLLHPAVLQALESVGA